MGLSMLVADKTVGGKEALTLRNYKGALFQILVDHQRDKHLTDFGRATLKDRYLLPGESFQGLFARVAVWFADDAFHAQRLYDYISKLWFMPATPVLSNGGTERGLPISCYLNSVGDNLESIIGTWSENSWLAARGGGIGTYWGDVRSIGEKVGEVGKTSGVVPFIKVMDSQTLAISQGSLRRGSAAAYLPVWHPEIEEFVEIRRPTGGDPNRRTLNLHHGIAISDEFMRAVETGRNFALTSPLDGHVVREVDARSLWQRILTARVETGEPYLLFIDTVNRQIPEHHKLAGQIVKQSNLCSEITLPTGTDSEGKIRAAVCCLSSLNLEKWDDYSDQIEAVTEDCLRFLDNVLSDFIRKTVDLPGFENVHYSAEQERSVGLGVMGFHGFLQSRNLSFEGAMAKSWNLRIFKTLRQAADKANEKLAEERGACPDAVRFGVKKRFSNMFAIAPTASISIIAGNASPGIEPLAANSFTQKTLSGSFNVRNSHLDKLLVKKWAEHMEGLVGLTEWLESIWSSITTQEGSVQHLTFLTEDEKLTFRTAFEIDQRWIIEHAADRTPYICQSQSVNLFLPANVSKRDLHWLHFTAWAKGMKSLYYCRSKSLQRADVVSHMAGTMPTEADRPDVEREVSNLDYDECLACQ